MNIQPIRFENRKESFFLVEPEEILFIHSADHYIKALIKLGADKKWMTRHCTLKGIFHLLPKNEFRRLNRFYIINLNYYSHIEYTEKKLYLMDGTAVPVPHRISRFVLEQLKS